MATTKVRWVHTYIDDSTTDLYGNGRCTLCSLPASNRLHTLAKVDTEVAAFEARKLGEADK